VNNASAGGILAVPFISDHCATKFGVVGLIESLRPEVKLKGYKKINFITLVRIRSTLAVQWRPGGQRDQDAHSRGHDGKDYRVD
jgi:NAD(P)-dependent dehydrogenase (short-subunit alcohol dehydrogenase family)